MPGLYGWKQWKGPEFMVLLGNELILYPLCNSAFWNDFKCTRWCVQSITISDATFEKLDDKILKKKWDSFRFTLLSHSTVGRKRQLQSTTLLCLYLHCRTDCIHQKWNLVFTRSIESLPKSCILILIEIDIQLKDGLSHRIKSYS